MNEEIILKDLPKCIVYCKEGVINNFSEINDFVLSAGRECLETNPDIKCIEPNYCFINYLDNEYKESNMRIRYAETVESMGVSNDTIKFMELVSVPALCIRHKGSYKGMKETYNKIMDYIKENNIEIIDYPREQYIDGIWNKNNEDDYLTEIQVPIKK